MVRVSADPLTGAGPPTPPLVRRCPGVSSEPPQDQGDPTQELEDLVDAHMAAHKVRRAVAYSRVVAARPDLNAALAQQRDAKLRKAARAIGDGYGMR
jgi:hypothetical protein